MPFFFNGSFQLGLQLWRDLHAAMTPLCVLRRLLQNLRLAVAVDHLIAVDSDIPALQDLRPHLLLLCFLLTHLTIGAVLPVPAYCA